MPAQIRPNRLEVTDRFPMLGFTLRTDQAPRVAEVVIATDPALFERKEGRTSATFYTSREHGPLSLSRAEAVYVVPPEVLARFVAAQKLWFGLATASSAGSNDWTVEVTPTAASPYVSLSGLSDRALRRVRMFPARVPAGYGGRKGGGATLEWAGDRARPGMAPVAARPVAAAPAPAPTNGTGAPAAATPPAHYDDGFGPLPPLNPPAAATPAPPAGELPTPPATAAQSYSRGLEADPDAMGIEDGVLDDEAAPQSMSLDARPRALTAAEYPGAQVMASPAYNNGRRGGTIDRIVIHITGAPQSRYLGSHFTREEANSSAHYMIDQNGAILQFVREQDTAWHARGANSRSIGIEHVAIQRGGARYQRRDGSWQTFPYTPPTDVELRTSAALVAHLCRKYGLTPDRTTIIGHREADPRTTHSVCPDGAWDWEGYMALVAEATAALPAAQGLSARGLDIDPEQMGIDTPAYSEEETQTLSLASGLALTAAENSRVTQVVPSPAFTAGRNGTAIDRIVIHITDAPTLQSTVNTFKAAGAQASAHYCVGPNGEIVQFVSEADTAWHARGSNRRSIGIEHVAVKRGGATYPRPNGTSVTFPYQPPTQLEYESSALLVSDLCDKYHLPKNRTTIIGHREADPGTSHSVCPDGAWDWDYFMRIVETGQCPVDPPTGQSLGDEIPLDPGVGGMSIGTDALQIGDIILSTTAQVPSAIIRAGSGAPVSHAMLYVGQGGQVIEAIGGGVVLRPLEQALAASSLAVAFRVPGLSETLRQQIADAAAAFIGQDFNYIGLVRYGLFRIDAGMCSLLPNGAGERCRAFVGRLDLGPGSTDRFFCSQLVLQAFSDAGRAITQDLPHWNSPGDIAELRMRDGALAYVGHLKAPIPRNSFFGVSQGLIENVRAQSLGGDDYSINWDDVQLINQPTDMSCWATAGAMLIGWRDNMSVTPQSVADLHGRSIATGLPPGETRPFADAIGLTAENNACYTADAFRSLIESKGPIFVVAKVPGVHAILVTGMYRQNGVDYVRITDPWDRIVGSPGAPGKYIPDRHDTGSRYIMTYDAFAAEYELAGNIDRIQLLHTNGTHGHTINRGSAAAAGYAQGLGADDWSVNWDDVDLIAQPTNVSCWATAAAMIDGWKRRQSASIDAIAAFDRLTVQNGLPWDDHGRFGTSIGFTIQPNACYTPEGFRDLIVSKGPIWVAAEMPFPTGLSGHAVAVTGMYSENGNYFVRISDPWDHVAGNTPQRTMRHDTGSRYIMPWADFAGQYEATGGQADFAQMLHTNGTHGHTINRGSARAAGYAQALDPSRDAGFGVGTALTRQTSEKNGRRYDLAQLSGMVQPANALAGGAGAPAMSGERIVLDDWPYIDGPSGRTQAGLAIDWRHQGGAVGDIVIQPTGGQVLDGWIAVVRADILAGEPGHERASLRVRVTTTFSRSGEEDQAAVTDVVLSGDGRRDIRHGADRVLEHA